MATIQIPYGKTAQTLHVADRVIFMDGGVIVEQGPAHDVIDRPQQERTRQFLSRYAQDA